MNEFEILDELRDKYGYNPAYLISKKGKSGAEYIIFSDRGRRVVAKIEKGKLSIVSDMAEEDVEFLVYEVVGLKKKKEE